jgi:hypothetical protein
MSCCGPQPNLALAWPTASLALALSCYVRTVAAVWPVALGPGLFWPWSSVELLSVATSHLALAAAASGECLCGDSLPVVPGMAELTAQELSAALQLLRILLL